MIELGWQQGWARGWHSARATLGWLWPSAALLGALAVVASAALVEAPSIAGAGAARSAEADLVRGVSFGLLLPLWCFALSARLDTGLDALMPALWVRHGAERRAFALGRLAFPMLLSGAVALVAGSLALALSAAVSDPLLDLPLGIEVSWWRLALVALLGAVSYGACLGLSQLVAGAWGRSLFLLADWLLGSGAGAFALPFPRAHVRGLLGGAAVFDLSAASAAEGLALLTALSLFLYLRRIPR